MRLAKLVAMPTPEIAFLTDEEAEMDLVEEMEWEDHCVFLTLQEAGLEEEDFDTVSGAQKVYFDEEY